MDPDPKHKFHLFHEITIYIHRNSGREDVLSELDRCDGIAATHFAESGDLFKMVGVLRACDIFWSKDSK